MNAHWEQLTRLTQGKPMVVERVRLAETGIAVEGAFELPPLASLPSEDQVFVAAFIHCHGSIKQMEQIFGVSYPTVKGRLNRIAARLPLAEVEAGPPRAEVLERLERGQITVDEALEQLKGK